MNGTEMREGRERLGWTQQGAAQKLGVSQSYLSLLEKGFREVREKLAKKAVRLYQSPPTAWPLPESLYAPPPLGAQTLAERLAGLGYPGFSHLRPKPVQNPAEVLFNALGQNDLESRLVEALPWLVLRYPTLDWGWLVPRAKVYNLQNRLGYVVYLGRKLAERFPADATTLSHLAHQQAALEGARLATEGTLCHDSLSSAERSWLRETRPPEAEHWNLLTDLRPEQLKYASA
jgi:transcriptional regulator with XRE-family HTH domain